MPALFTTDHSSIFKLPCKKKRKTAMFKEKIAKDAKTNYSITYANVVLRLTPLSIMHDYKFRPSISLLLRQQ